MTNKKPPSSLVDWAAGLRAAEKQLRAGETLSALGAAIKRTQSTWNWMNYRCNNPQCHGYHNYGGRGIRVCKRWRKFVNFIKDMGIRPLGMVIDRKDNDGHYTPKNCRWVTVIQNARHRRSSKIPYLEGETELERHRKVHRDWVARNKEHRRNYMIAYCKKHREHRRKTFWEWSIKNREYRNAYMRAWESKK